MKLTKSTKIGLTLNGGGTKTAIYLGVLQGLLDKGYNIEVIGGLSGGAIISGLYANGYTIEQIGNIYEETKISSLLDTNPFDGISILDHKKMEEVLNKYIGDKKFEDCNKKVLIFATDLKTQRHHVFNKGPIVPAIVASSSIPPFFSAYEYNGHRYIDGGFTIQYGAKYFREAGAEYVIGTDVNGFSNAHFPGPIDALYKSISCALNELSIYEKEYSPVDLEIKDFKDDTGMLDSNIDADRLIKIGLKRLNQCLD